MHWLVLLSVGCGLLLFGGCEPKGSNAAKVLNSEAAEVPSQTYTRDLSSMAVFDRYSFYDPAMQVNELKYLILLDGVEGSPKDLIFFQSNQYAFHEDFFKDPSNQEFFQGHGFANPNYQQLAMVQGRRYMLSGSVFWNPRNEFYFQIYANGQSFEDNVHDVKKHHEVLSSMSPLIAQHLSYYPIPRYSRRYKDRFEEYGLPTLTSQNIFPRTQVGYVLGSSLGFLKQYDEETFTKLVAGGKDFSAEILILDHLPFELPPSAGVITMVPQSALAHVSVKSRQRKIPNAYALERELKLLSYTSKLDKPVRFSVKGQSIEIELSDEGAVGDYLNRLKESRRLSLEARNYEKPDRALLDLSELRNADEVGAKARNYSWLQTHVAGISQTHADIDVRPGFAISQYYFREFLQHNQMESKIRSLLEEIKAQPLSKAKHLKSIRKMIENEGLIDVSFKNELIQQLSETFSHLSASERIRFRSSANVEDLPGFSGAGLYESTWTCLQDLTSSATKSQCNDKFDKKAHTLEVILRKVWASVFSDRAYDEREFYGIDHNLVNMGILVNHAYENEDVNGVAISADLEGVLSETAEVSPITIHLLPNELSVVLPEKNMIPEKNVVTNQVVFHEKSTLARDRDLLSPEQLIDLAKAIRLLEEKYLEVHQLDQSAYAVDIEFKAYKNQNGLMDFSFKQIRPYKK